MTHTQLTESLTYQLTESSLSPHVRKGREGKGREEEGLPRRYFVVSENNEIHPSNGDLGPMRHGWVAQ